MSRSTHAWRDAATLLLAARIDSKQSLKFPVQNLKAHKSVKRVQSSMPQYDYKLLMLTRSGKSKFMPNAVVFPGGILGDCDFSSRWGKLFNQALNVKQMNNENTRLFPAGLKHGAARPAVFKKYDNMLDVPSEMAFRVCAIREAFEECGVLLALPKEQAKTAASFHDYSFLKKHQRDIAKWRKEINKDDNLFVEMCEELNVVPNVWALSEWSNWLTPTHMTVLHSNRRYDTMFYMTCLEETVEFREDDHEIVSAEWQSPLEALIRHRQEKHWLAPPQVYEMCRLLNITKLEDLQKHLLKRQREGTECWLPVRVGHTNGMTSLLPGDDSYPTDVDWLGERESPEDDRTMEEALTASQKYHRFEFRGLYDTKIQSNIEPAHGHLCPAKGQLILDQVLDQLH